MNTYIVLIPIKNNREARNMCENIESICFTFDKETPTAKHIYDKIKEYLSTDCDIEVESLTDFMDRINDTDFDSNNYFMSYVHAIKQ